ncbi:hypothetical protein [Deinococcus maricopensis]|uniref:Uncharacterized protein n=1 Tax=Deinococcus maricopensis (strain DSM 21211 / LMG 22137 / NRRL B-23946 / LB-34) TaxID=709986 RepID=E8U5T7_DEIML|nr:hypothetical protein [Deinococcus maricopensis]ADV66426.1 hypothetical protein Deima_0770 [Deinococcus maricopensis DSM 21211]
MNHHLPRAAALLLPLALGLASAQSAPGTLPARPGAAPTPATSAPTRPAPVTPVAPVGSGASAATQNDPCREFTREAFAGKTLTAEQEQQRAASERRCREAESGNPDVLLDIPNVSVEQITLEVDDLQAHVALDARLANLLKLTAGADVSIAKVKLDIKGVRAQALLKVNLDNVERIIDRTLTTIDRNPQILEKLLTTVDNTVSTVGGVANNALQPGGVVDKAVGTVGGTLSNVTQPGGLLGQTVNNLGQTVQRVLDASGNIVERTVTPAGEVLGQAVNVGTLSSLKVLKETTNAAGQVVRQIQDTSGAVFEVTLDQNNKVIAYRLLQAAPAQGTPNK